MARRTGPGWWIAVVVACAAGETARAADEAPRAAVQWRVSEIELTAAREHPDPLAVAVVAEFAHAGGARYRIPAFWDGGRTWRVRFTPTVPGEWTFATSAATTRPAEADAGLYGVRGALRAAPAGGENPLHRHGGFLKVSANKRHLTYADGTPFFWLGDTWWFCPSALMPIDRSNRPGIASMYKHLMDVRAGQGYTAIHMAFLGPASGVSGRYADLFDGKCDPAYWRGVDAYIGYANDKGLVPVIGLGFHRGLDGPTLEQLERLWGYALARYGAHAVTFLISGEYNLADAKADPQRQADERRAAKVLALGRFIKAHDPYGRAMTVHPWWIGGDKRQAWPEAWYDFIMVQGGHGKEGPAGQAYRDIYARPDPKPLLEGECTYEGIRGYGADVVRHNAYKAIQCGSFGFTYGAHGLWYPTQDERDEKFKEWGKPVPWWEAIGYAGGAQMKHLRACYESVEWWRLEPVAAGQVMAVEPAPAAGREVLVKADAARKVIVAYVPARQAAGARVRLRGAAAGGRYAVTRFDPRTGRADAAGTVAGPDGALPALPEGAADWVLILRAE